MLRRTLIALQLLTRIPVTVTGELAPADLGKSAAAFPIVGVLIGMILSGVYILTDKIFPSDVAVALVLVTMVLVTGGLHVDGLMDTADGIGSGRSRERMLEIMRDSRVGSMGVMAAGLVYLLKFVLLGAIPAGLVGTSLLGVPVLSRWAMVVAIYSYPYARSGPGTGKPFADYVSWQELLVATVITLAVIGWLWRWPGLLAAAVTFGVTSSLAFFLNSRLGGLTGDCYGAVNELVEVTVLLVLVARATSG